MVAAKRGTSGARSKAAAKKQAAGKPAAKGAAARPAAQYRVNGIDGVRSMLANSKTRGLAIDVVSVTKKRIVARLEVKTQHMNRGERVNGGILMAFADILGAAGTVMNLAPGWRTTTLESKTNFFAAGEGPVISALCTPLHVGRSTNVWQTRITNADGRLVAMVTQTQIVLPPPAAPAGG
jgi:uncharacterized protein (TIGR00369 family)